MSGIVPKSIESLPAGVGLTMSIQKWIDRYWLRKHIVTRDRTRLVTMLVWFQKNRGRDLAEGKYILDKWIEELTDTSCTVRGQSNRFRETVSAGVTRWNKWIQTSGRTEFTDCPTITIPDPVESKAESVRSLIHENIVKAIGVEQIEEYGKKVQECVAIDNNGLIHRNSADENCVDIIGEDSQLIAAHDKPCVTNDGAVVDIEVPVCGGVIHIMIDTRPRE